LKQQNQQQNMGNCNGDVSSVTEMPSEAMKASKSSGMNMKYFPLILYILFLTQQILVGYHLVLVI